jgi:hypothetical protein
MFMICALAMVVRVDRTVEQGGSVLQQFSKPAQKTPTTPTQGNPAPTQQPAPQSSTPQQQPAPSTPAKP